MSDICKNDGTYFNQWGVCELCGNSREKQDAAERAQAQQAAAPVQAPQAAAVPNFCMKCGGRMENGVCPNCSKPAAPAPTSNFCMKCGGQLNGAAFCPNCGTPANQAAAVQPAQPSAFTLLLKETWDYVKAFFTSNPFAAIQNAAASKSHIWAVLATVICIITALGFFSVFAHEIDMGSMSMLGSAGVNVISVIAAIVLMTGDTEALYSASDKIENLGEMLQSNAAIFFSGLFIIILVFFAFSALLKLFFVITKKNVGWITVFNIQATALLPFAVTAAVAAIFALFSPVLAIALLLLGTLFYYISLYFGIQKAAQYTKSPFWLYAVLVVAHYLAIYLIVLLFYAIFC